MAATGELVRPELTARTTTSSRRIVSNVLGYIVCILVAALCVFPFLWMLSTSFKEPTEAITLPPNWIPSPFILDNYTGLFTDSLLPFPSSF